MANGKDESSRHTRWAQLRFSIIGPLLAAPPARGELRGSSAAGSKAVEHPVTGKPTQFGFSTLERWSHMARGERDIFGDGVAAAGAQGQWAAAAAFRETAGGAVRAVPAAPELDYQLHADNLAALCAGDKTWTGAIVRHHPALHEGAGAGAGAREVGHAGCRARPGPARCARGALVRGGVRQWSVALRFSHRAP